MENKEKFELTKIKTAKEVLDEVADRVSMEEMGEIDVDSATDLMTTIAIQAMKEYAEQFINYISENIDADYEYLGNHRDLKDEVEVFCGKAQFEEFKKLIK